MNPMKQSKMPKELGMSAPEDEVKPMKVRGMPSFMSRAKRPGGMAKGGKVHDDAAMDRKLIRQEINKAHSKMGVKKMAKGGGVEARGKTRGKLR